MLIPDSEAGWTRGWLSFGRWGFRTGDGRTIARLDDTAYRNAENLQRSEPFLIGRQRGRQWWWYQDRFYSDEAGLFVADVRAIVSGRSVES